MKNILTVLFLSSWSLVAVCSHAAPAAPTTPTTQTYSSFPAGATPAMMDMAAARLTQVSVEKRHEERRIGHDAIYGTPAVLADAVTSVAMLRFDGAMKRWREEDKS